MHTLEARIPLKLSASDERVGGGVGVGVGVGVVVGSGIA